MRRPVCKGYDTEVKLSLVQGNRERRALSVAMMSYDGSEFRVNGHFGLPDLPQEFS